jgi:predicted protein tyrosine phosphatase
MPRHVRRLRPSCVVSLLPGEDQPDTPTSIAVLNHLRLTFHDVDEPESGAPERHHVEALIGFLHARPRASVLFHCMAGISRSTAAALIAMTLDWPGREREAAMLMRRRAPHAWPNRLILRHADAILGREGRLIAAREAMGDPEFAAPALLTLPRWTSAPARPGTAPSSVAERARRRRAG